MGQAPATRAEPVVEVLHGTRVVDPYRWLEDADSSRVRDWAAAHDARTRRALDSIPGREQLRARIARLLEAGSVSDPAVAGGRVFTLERWGDRQQAVVVVRPTSHPAGGDPGLGSHPAPGPGAEPPAGKILVDPGPLAGDHAVALDWFSPSPDGRLLAYGTSEGGSEHGTLRIVEVDTGCELPDTIGPVRHPSLAWLPDGSAFAYSRLPDPATVPPGEQGYWERVWWHRVGDDPGGDEPVEVPGLDRTALPMAVISPEGRWLAIHVHRMPSRTDVVLLDRATGRRTTVVEGREASTWCQLTDTHLWAVTTVDAPRGRVVRAGLDRPAVESWETVVAESDAVVEHAVVAGGSLVVATTTEATSRLWRHPLGGGPGKPVALPGLGALTGLDADPGRDEAFVVWTSFGRPPALWRWRPGEDLRPWSDHAPPVGPEALAVEQVTYPSSDGTPVPLFLVRAATTVPSPDTPTVLSAYGGFAISSVPAFSPGVVAWCEAEGQYALAGIRGGGERGEDWHRAGMLGRKQQCFDDFAAAADWLVATGRTSPARLGIRGGSNGGLLVGAALTQRPRAYRAVVCAVPLLDMLRYHRFLIGALWVPEYGDPGDPEAFAWLAAYSPYHHLVEGTAYPAALVTAGESDSRVDPLHARKFVARLLAATASDPVECPVLLRLEARAGHGAGKPSGKQADEAADAWGFLAHELGLDLAGVALAPGPDPGP